MKIMGIINITPDSFYNDSRLNNFNALKLKIQNLVSLNTDIIDIGAESSRPGSNSVPINIEIDRLKPVFEIVKQYPETIFSIDTYKSEIAKICLDNGFKIVNDIYAGTFDENMFRIVSKYNAKIVLMHMNSNPRDMQKNIHYDDIILDINQFFDSRIKEAMNNGVKKSNIIIDPGIGFGKTEEHNYLIINSIDSFKKHGVPVLIGASRKSFLSIDNDKPNDRLSATIVSSTIAYQNEADFLRVHDVLETQKCININNKFLMYKN
tara:strand:+ start:111 stop:902 length:792 start_codon:yes stop_codon:yes gene_type:complete